MGPTEEQRIGKWQDSLLGLLVPVSALDEDPNNARLHGDRNLEVISNSLQAFSQCKPVVHWTPPGMKRPIVICGNGTFRSAKALGWSHVAAVAFKGTEAQARAYALVDNRAAELAQWDTTRVESHMDIISKGWEQASGDLPGWIGFDSVQAWDAPREQATEYVPPNAEASPLGAPAARPAKERPTSKIAADSFPLIVHCRTGEERAQIRGELEKHGIKCESVR